MNIFSLIPSISAPCSRYRWSVGWYAEMKGEAMDAAKKEQELADHMQGMMKAQFATQNAILKRLDDVFFKFVEDPTGFGREETAAMRTQATEQNSQEFQNAEQAFQNKANIMGGREIPSGANLQAELLLQTSRARQEADSQRQITLNDAMLKRTNQFNAASILSGSAAMMNPVGYGQIASNTMHNASGDLLAASQNPLLGGILGGVFGMGESFLSGGMSTLMKPKAG